MNADELESFLVDRLELQQVRRSGENITACCPNHLESRPSWGIRIDSPHLHACFSCGFKGTLRTLLIHKGWTITKVTALLGVKDRVTHGFSMNVVTQAASLPSAEELWPFILEPTAIQYMRHRGINYTTLKAAKVVFHELDQRVLFPWFINGEFHGVTGRTIDPDNNVKIQAYFGLRKSQALYLPSGQLPKEATTIPIVEGEIDALKVFQSGFPFVIALGQGNFSDDQALLFESLPVNSDFVLMLDSDDVGVRLTKTVFDKLSSRGFQKIRAVKWRDGHSQGKTDPAMLSSWAIRRIIKGAKLYVDWQINCA